MVRQVALRKGAEMVQQRRDYNSGEIRLVNCAGCREELLGAA